MKHKWIEDRPGAYKTVPLDDPRPEITLPDKAGAPNLHIAPPWAVHEADAHSDDTDTQVRGTDAFLAEKAKWTKASSKWARHEHSRKQTLKRDKQAFLKKQAEKRKGGQ